MPMSTQWVVIKMFKTDAAVMNLPEIECKCIWPPHTLRKMVRQAKGAQGHLQKRVAFEISKY